MAGAATAAQRQMFRMKAGFSKGPALSISADIKSNRLRDAYNAGQRCFRNGLRSIAGLEPTIFQLEEHLSMIDSEVDREGFAMGWQSDQYAYDNGMTLSVLGGTRWEPEESGREYTPQEEGRYFLDEPDQY